MGEVPLQVKYHPDGPGTEKELVMDFTPPFKRVSMISGLEEVLGIKLPSDYSSEECRAYLDKVDLLHLHSFFFVILYHA